MRYMLLSNSTSEVNINKPGYAYRIYIDDYRNKAISNFYVLTKDNYIYRPIYFIGYQQHNNAVYFRRYLCRKSKSTTPTSIIDVNDINSISLEEDDIIISITDHGVETGWVNRWTTYSKDIYAKLVNPDFTSSNPDTYIWVWGAGGFIGFVEILGKENPIKYISWLYVPSGDYRYGFRVTDNRSAEYLYGWASGAHFRNILGNNVNNNPVITYRVDNKDVIGSNWESDRRFVIDFLSK